MAYVQIDGNSVLGHHFNQIYQNLYQKQNVHMLAQAYKGEHDLGFAEPEFAGKYLDISSCYARILGDAEAVKNAAYVVESIIQNQREDGYLGGYRAGSEFQSFSVWNQAFTCHGLIAYWDVTADERALHAAERCITYIAEQFKEKGNLLAAGNEGSQHLAIFLPAVQLYIRTQNEAYLRFCKWMIQSCLENVTFDFIANPYALGVASQKGIEMLSFMIGVCLYGNVVQDQACMQAVKTYWQDLRENQITNTGCGTISEHWRPHGNQPAMLPLEVRPNENCVAVGWMELSLLLYHITGESKYFDAVEQSLYNHLLGSKAPDGSDFAYYQGNYGTKIIAKNPRSYSCCRFRGMAMMAHLPECVVFLKENSLSFALYTSFEQNLMINDVGVKLSMRTDYPSTGKIELVFITS